MSTSDAKTSARASSIFFSANTLLWSRSMDGRERNMDGRIMLMRALPGADVGAGFCVGDGIRVDMVVVVLGR